MQQTVQNAANPGCLEGKAQGGSRLNATDYSWGLEMGCIANASLYAELEGVMYSATRLSLLLPCLTLLMASSSFATIPIDDVQQYDPINGQTNSP